MTRIALTVDPELPVPPRLYGGIERIVDLLAQGLAARNHDVTLFAHPESRTAGRLVAWPGLASRSAADTARNAAMLAREVMQGRFDLVHSFSRIAYMTPILPLPIPKLMSYQRAITPRTVRFGHAISGGSLSFSAASEWMFGHVKNIGRWSVVPNGVALEAYDFAPTVAADAPFVFLGRIEAIKGPHLAIEIAKRTGTRLVLAGNVEPNKQEWFDAHIAPHLDGSAIRYIGPVDDRQKSELLRTARALLMPILWDEPFGIVMIEAMVCGTPVLGLRRGAVPEVVQDGVTGFVRDNVEDLIAAAGELTEIDRASCRERVERLYSRDAIVTRYLRVYDELISRRTR